MTHERQIARRYAAPHCGFKLRARLAISTLHNQDPLQNARITILGCLDLVRTHRTLSASLTVHPLQVRAFALAVKYASIGARTAAAEGLCSNFCVLG
jgi:hypothetical protein